MSTNVNNEQRFPIGAPKNRKPEGDIPKPVPGRPNWWVKRDGVPYYVEPPVPLPDLTLCLSPAVAWMVDRLESVQPAAPAAEL